MLFFGKTLLAVATVAALGSAHAGRGFDHPRKERRIRKGHPTRSLIVGGTPANFADYPYFVDLRSCAGTLIWEDIVLTAAHCNRPDHPGWAVVGPDFEERTLLSSTMHPDYDLFTQENDIWVVKLDSPVDMARATLVELNSDSQVPSADADIEIIGMGFKFEGDRDSYGPFTKTNVQEVPLAQCQEAYFDTPLAVTNSELCAAALGKDACQGDSGGPALVGNIQVGIISQGIGCADPDFPGLYARVSEAHDWIKRQICCQAENPPADCPVVDASECPNDLASGSPTCFEARFNGFCVGTTIPSSTGTADGCKGLTTDLTEVGRSIDFPYFDSGDGNCVEVPGVKPIGDCCQSDQCFEGDGPGIPEDPAADCAVAYNLNDCPEGYTSYFYDYELGSCTSISSDSGGDPHIQTFDGKYFDYHGACDLVLVSSAEFDLDIHIRTTSRYQYSYIESAVLRIGDNTLEVSSWGEHALDGIGGVDLSIENAKLAQFPIYHTRPSSDSSAKHHVFDVVVGPHQNITFSTFKDLVSVKITEGSKAIFGDSVGLMGSFSGKLLARDGTPMLVEDDGASAFGQEWQVKPDEPLLFRTARAPFAGEKCLLPSEAKQRQRRLGEATIAREDAERACSRFTGTKLENCVFDVMAVGDLDLANSL